MAWHGYQVVATYWALISITLVMVVIRIYVQVLHAVCLTIQWRLGIVDIDSIEYGKRDYSHIPLEDKIWWSKLDFISMFAFPFGVWALRALLLLLYMDLCPRHLFPRLYWFIIAAWVYMGVTALVVSVIWPFVQCLPRPISDYWRRGFCNTHIYWIWSVILAGVTGDIIGSWRCFSTLSLVGRLTAIERIGSFAMFAIGFVNIGMLVVDFYIMTRWKDFNYPDSAEEHGVAYFVQILQVPTGIIIVCMPSLRILGRWRFSQKIARSISRNHSTDGVLSLKSSRESHDYQRRAEIDSLKRQSEEQHPEESV